MKITGLINTDKQYEHQDEGMSCSSYNMIINNSGVPENEDGINNDNTGSEDSILNDVAGVIEFSDMVIVFYEAEPVTNAFENNYAKIININDNTRTTIKMIGGARRSTFGGVGTYNYKGEHIITYLDYYNNVRTLNIEDNSIDYYNGNLDISRLTPNLKLPLISNVVYIDGGNLKTGKYHIVTGYEIEYNTVVKWSPPQGPYVVSDHDETRYLTHSDDLDSVSGKSLSFKINAKNTSSSSNQLFTILNIAIISEINGITSVNIIKRISATINEDIEIIYGGTESISASTIDEVTIPKIHINKAKAITTFQDAIYLANIEEFNEDILTGMQAAMNNVVVKFNSESLDIKHITVDQQVIEPIVSSDSTSTQGLLPDEVYAFNANIVLANGTTREYHIPGHAPVNFTGVRGSNSISAYEDSEVSTAIQQDELDIGYIEGYPYPQNLKVFQLINTSSGLTIDTLGVAGGYWENEDELYPDIEEYGALRNLNVRHHRVPAFDTWFNKHQNAAFSVYAKFSNIVLPVAALPYIKGIYFSAAKRTTSNSLIAGISAGIPGNDDLYENEASAITVKYSNAVDFRLYDFNLLANLPSINFKFIKPIYEYSHSVVSADDRVKETEFDYIYKYSNSAETSLAITPIDAMNASFHAITSKAYFPEGNSATLPPNIYTIADESIVNRESCLHVDLWKGIDNISANIDASAFLTGLRKQVFALYNWNKNVYVPFNNQDTMIISDIIPITGDISSDVIDANGGDIFAGVNSINLKYKYTDIDTDAVDDKLSWFGFSTIIPHACDIANVKYNISATGINDLHTVVKYDPLNDIQFQTKLKYRVLSSNSQQTESKGLDIRLFDANAYSEIPKTKGVITNIIGQDKVLLIQTPDTTWIYRLNDTLKTNEITAYLGKSDIFAEHPKELIPSIQGAGGNQHYNSNLISKHGVLFADAVNGDILLITDTITNLSILGMQATMKYYLENAEYIDFAYDSINARFLISIMNSITGDVMYSFDPIRKGWISAHSTASCIPFRIGAKIAYLKIGDIDGDNRLFIHDSLSPSLNMIDYTKTLANDDSIISDAYIDVSIRTPNDTPLRINSIYFKTICRSLLDINNYYLKDKTINNIMIYTRTKCTGIVDIDKQLNNKNRSNNNSISLKHDIWRYNKIADMIIHYVNNAAKTYIPDTLIDRPLFIDPISKKYDPTILSSSVGGTRPAIKYYDQVQFIDSYCVVRLIINTNIKRKVAISDIALSLTEINKE